MLLGEADKLTFTSPKPKCRHTHASSISYREVTFRLIHTHPPMLSLCFVPFFRPLRSSHSTLSYNSLSLSLPLSHCILTQAVVNCLILKLRCVCAACAPYQSTLAVSWAGPGFSHFYCGVYFSNLCSRSQSLSEQVSSHFVLLFLIALANFFLCCNHK